MGRDVELFRRHLYSDGKPKPTSNGTVGAELVEGLVIEEEDYKLVKTRFSAFFNTHLHSYLQGVGISKLVITGNMTSINSYGLTLIQLLAYVAMLLHRSYGLISFDLSCFRCSNTKLY